MSISRIFDISKRALLANQMAINTTARNVTNANTEGYRRRRVDMSRLNPQFLGFGSINGFSGNISLIRNRFVENQLWYENQNLGKYQSDEMILTQVEGIFGEPLDSGLANVLSEFWNSWNDLANDPESQSARSIVRDKGILLSNTFKRVNLDLKNLQEQIRIDIQENVVQVNRIVQQIRNINDKINASPSDDLLDQRDLLITDLSSMINIDVRENTNGEVIVSTGGQILVSGNYINELSVDITTEDNTINVNLKLGDNDLGTNVTSGKLGSLYNIHNQKIQGYLDKLDILAKSIATEVNSVHSTGYNIDGLTGYNFFAKGVTGADDINVNDEIVQDTSLIATSSMMDESGNGSIALAISDLQFSKLIQGDTISSFYNSLQSQIGSDVQQAVFSRGSQEMVVQSLQNQRDSVSGVSIDEEMTNLIKYEQAYQAAARLISSADEMVQTVLNLI